MFDKPSTLADYWDGLLQGYALDAVGQPPTSPTPDGAERFLAEVRSCPAVERPGAGLGTEIHAVHDRVAAVALRWDGTVVHLVAFSTAGTTRRRSRPIARTR